MAMGCTNMLGKYEEHRDSLRKEIRVLKDELDTVRPKYLQVMSIIELRKEKADLKKEVAEIKRKLSGVRFKSERKLRLLEKNEELRDIQEREWEQSERNAAQLNERLESELQTLKEELWYNA